MSNQDYFRDYCREASRCFEKLEVLSGEIGRATDLALSVLQEGGRVFLCGNGGSAADAQHIAAELVGRFKKERKALPAIALTTDTSALTAIANDYAFDKVFSRQLEALAAPGDLLIAISTSGNSGNVIAALQEAHRLNLKSIGLTGAKGGRMADMTDICIRVPSDETSHIQEMHIAVGHMICAAIESHF